MKQNKRVRKENSFSHQSKSDISLFMAEKNRFDNENAMIEQMKKTPMTESQVSEMLHRGRNDLQVPDTQKRLKRVMDQMRQDGLIIPDPPISFSEFKSKNPNHNIIKASWLQQLSVGEYTQFKSAGQFKVFQDLPSGKRVLHFQYLQGLNWTQTGYGMSIQLEALHYPERSKQYDKEQKKLIEDAQKRYAHDRREINLMFEKLGLLTDEMTDTGHSTITPRVMKSIGY